MRTRMGCLVNVWVVIGMCPTHDPFSLAVENIIYFARVGKLNVADSFNVIIFCFLLHILCSVFLLCHSFALSTTDCRVISSKSTIIRCFCFSQSKHDFYGLHRFSPYHNYTYWCYMGRSRTFSFVNTSVVSIIREII